LIKIGNGASANTYTGGTEIRHVVNTTYGTGHGVGVNSLLINAVNTGAFGTGDVTLNSQGLNTSAVTTLTGGSGGLQLVLSADNSMGSTAVLTQSGNGAGTVYLGSTSQTIGGLVSTTTNKRIQTGNGILSIVTAADRSYSGAIVGSGAINIGGTHTQTFDGANTFTGVTTFKGGSLGVATIGDGGVASGNLGSATADAANLVFDGGALKYTGASSSTNRSFTINNLKTAIINVSESATELTMSGNSGASTGGLTKQGLGTLILTGTHAYTGNTLVSGGILKLGATGSLSSASKITVSSGATFDVSATAGYTVGDNETLDGSGTIVGNVTIGDGGFHAPGNSPGVQEIDGNLAYLENSRLLWDLTVPTDPSDNFSSEIQTGRGTSWDGIDVTGDLTGAGGIFRIILSGSNDFTGAFWLEGRRWEGVFSAPNSDLFDLNTIFTSFEFYNAGGSIAGPLEGEFSFDGSDLVFAIPEPSSALFGLLIGAGLLRRRRAA
jgi:autotransporter-associated beta strand protein